MVNCTFPKFHLLPATLHFLPRPFQEFHLEFSFLLSTECNHKLLERTWSVRVVDIAASTNDPLDSTPPHPNAKF